MQIVSYGASATVNLFVGGVLVLTYTGSISLTGVSNLDQVWLAGNANAIVGYSQVLVADEDTRALIVTNLAPTSDGTTHSWTGAYSTVNLTAFTDATPNYTNTSAQDQQSNVTDLPTGAFVIRAVKIAARALKSASSTPTKLRLGYNDGGTVAFGGAAQSLTAAWATYEQLDLLNPNGSVAWAQSIMNALQLDMQSVA